MDQFCGESFKIKVSFLMVNLRTTKTVLPGSEILGSEKDCYLLYFRLAYNQSINARLEDHVLDESLYACSNSDFFLNKIMLDNRG